MNRDKTFRIVLVVVAVVALIAGIWWLQGRQDRSNQEARDKQRYASLVSTTDTFVANRKYDQAESGIKKYLNDNPPKKYERGAMVLLATTYSNHEKYDDAITWYKKVEKNDGKDKADVVVGLAYTYESKGDKENAIAYFKKAIVLAENSKDPMANADKRSYQYEIKRLEGGEQ